jgi:hypothetical protein
LTPSAGFVCVGWLCLRRPARRSAATAAVELPGAWAAASWPAPARTGVYECGKSVATEPSVAFCTDKMPRKSL